MKKFVFAAIISAAAVLRAAEPAFYANFDDTLAPVIARGEKTFSSDTPPQFRDGVRGKALLIGTDDTGNRHGAAYPVQGNFDWEKGAVSLWFKPVNWKGSDQNFFIFFFCTFAKNSHFLLYKYLEKEIFYINRGGGIKIHNAQAQTGEWRQGQWHHLVCNFDDLQLAIYLDGKLVTERRRVFPFTPEKPEKNFMVGETKRCWLYKKNGRLSLIDEFKIFDRPLSYDEVRTLYKQDAAAARMTTENLITVPKHPNTFRSTGFTDFATGEFANRQYRYTLSFDDKYLYARISPADDKAAVVLTSPEGKEQRYPLSGETKIPVPGKQGWMINIVTASSDLDGGARLVLDEKRASSGIHSVCNKAGTELNLNVLPSSDALLAYETDSTLMYGYRRYIRDLQNGFTWTIKDMQDWLLVSLRLMDKATKKEFYRTDLRIRKNLPLAVKFMYTLIKERKLRVAFQGRKAGKVSVEFCRDGKAVKTEEQTIPKISGSFFDLDFPIKADTGTYAVRISHVSPQGEKVQIWEQDLRIPPENDPLVAPYTDPDENKVPQGWTPVKVAGSTVDIWGRTIKFDSGVLFGSIVSQGKNLLAEPDALVLDGKKLTPQSIKVEKISANDVSAKFRKTVDYGVLKAMSLIDVAFDGYTQIKLEIVPAAPMTVKSLEWELPMENKHARLLRGNRTFSEVTGKIGDAFTMPFVVEGFRVWPLFWIGDYRVGLNFTAEHLINWHFRDTSKHVTFKRDAQAGRLRIRFVAAPLKLDKARTFEFGLTPTPNKPLRRELLRARCKNEWQPWFKPWKYFNNLDPDKIFTKPPYFGIDYLNRQHKIFKELFHYSAYNFVSPFIPEFAWYEEEWRQLLRNGIGTWILYSSPCAAACINGEKYRNYRIRQWKSFIERPNNPLMIKGTWNLYFDAPWEESCRNPVHGCRDWVDAVGRPHTYLLINHFRTMSLALHRMLRRRYPDAMTCYHHEWQRSLPSHGFTDVFQTGEGMENRVGGQGSYYGILSPGMFAATMSPYIWSVKTIFIPQVVRGIQISAPARYRTYDIDKPVWRKAHLHYMGYAVTHDVDLSERNKLSRQLWAAQDAVGWNEKTVFHPYYDDEPAVKTSPANDNIVASAYTNGGRMLLAVLNDTDKEAAVTLTLDLKKLDVKPGMTGRDVWDPASSFTLDGTITMKIPSRGFRLIPFVK